jgi:hypothetical protein
LIAAHVVEKAACLQSSCVRSSSSDLLYFRGGISMRAAERSVPGSNDSAISAVICPGSSPKG